MTRLKELRDRTGLTLMQIAERLGINYTTICKWEVKGTIPRQQAIKICNEFGCSLEWLLPESIESDTTRKASIGKRFQEIRAFLNWTLQEMAEKLDVTVGTISLWERNGSIPDRRLKSIAEKCNVNYEWFVSGEGSMFTENKSSPKLGTPKDLAVIYGFDHRTAEAIERYVQLPADKRLEFSETLAFVMLGRPAVGTAKLNARQEIAENVATIKKTISVKENHSDSAATAEVKISPEIVEEIENREQIDELEKKPR